MPIRDRGVPFGTRSGQGGVGSTSASTYVGVSQTIRLRICVWKCYASRSSFRLRTPSLGGCSLVRQERTHRYPAGYAYRVWPLYKDPLVMFSERLPVLKFGDSGVLGRQVDHRI